jgi:hypothetical protein
MATPPPENLGLGFYHLLKFGVTAIDEIRFQLRNNGSTLSGATETITGAPSAGGTTINFPNVLFDNVPASDFNEMAVFVQDNTNMLSGQFDEVAVWTFGTQNSSGNNVEVSNIRLAFSSAENGAVVLANNTASGAGISYELRVKSGGTVRDTTAGLGSFDIDGPKERLQRTVDADVENTGSTTSTVDNSDLRVTDDSGATYSTVVTTLPYNESLTFAPGTIIRHTSIEVFFAKE